MSYLYLKYSIIWIICGCLWVAPVDAYVYGLKSSDNTIANIHKIANHYPQADPQIISMIRDGRSLKAKQEVINFAQQYGTSKVLHLTLSPDRLSINQIAQGEFDEQYRDFFALIKKLGIKVIFRTMHEMNGGWFAWSGNPKLFVQSWKHIWRLSRRVWLDRSQILFDFSVVHHDLPSVQADPSHTNDFVACTPSYKLKTRCITMEDYYPGDMYVDLVGVTFYNRGKGRHHRKRLMPKQIIEDPTWSMRVRLQQFRKPIIVDEVATTAVDYPGPYDPTLSLAIYESDHHNKNKRLEHLASRAMSKPNLVGLIYFNVDYTAGYKHHTIGESDRSVIDFQTSKIYTSIYKLAQWWQSLQSSQLFKLFSIPR